MINRKSKYDKALQILDNEIEYTHGLFLEYVRLANTIKDETVRKDHLRIAE